MTQRGCNRRILAEIKEYQKQIDINGEEGFNKFWIKYNTEDITIFEILLQGLEDTPYEAGWFYFTGVFPDNYPNSPPELVFQTTNRGQVRFHPNLYQTGKVCLSILGTWSGQPWTSVMTLEQVCLSIQSIMNSNPIVNEPGFENEDIKSPRASNYICTARYNTFRYALIAHWNRTTNLPEKFQKIVENNMFEGRGLNGYYRKKLESYADEYANSIASTSSGSPMITEHKFDWKGLLRDLSGYVGDWSLRPTFDDDPRFRSGTQSVISSKSDIGSIRSMSSSTVAKVSRISIAQASAANSTPSRARSKKK